MSPVVLAANIGINAKTLRAWLREQPDYDNPGKGGRWEIDQDLAMKAWWYFRGRHL